MMYLELLLTRYFLENCILKHLISLMFDCPDLFIWNVRTFWFYFAAVKLNVTGSCADKSQCSETRILIFIIKTGMRISRLYDQKSGEDQDRPVCLNAVRFYPLPVSVAPQPNSPPLSAFFLLQRSVEVLQLLLQFVAELLLQREKQPSM